MSQALFSLFLGFFLVTSCGRKSSSSEKKTVPIIPQELEEILDQQSFICQNIDREDCPFGIGRLFIVNENDPATSSVCTGFLIGPSRLLTNNHCVSSSAECRNTYVSIYTPSGPEKARCRGIVYTRGDLQIASQKAVDLSVIELDRRISGPVFNISNSRTSPGRSVRAWVIDHMNLREAAITELSCRYSALAGSMILRECPAISGNSGSPIVDRNSGRVVGILWGSNLPPSIGADLPIDDRRNLRATSLATELFPLRSEINE